MGVHGIRSAWSVLLLFLLAACATPGPSTEARRMGHQTDSALPADWTLRDLPGKQATQYSLSERGARHCILAQADSSASLLRRHVAIKPDELHQVAFDWWIGAFESSIAATDEPIDDAPASLVLAFDGDVSRLSLRTRMMFELAHSITGEAPPYATLMYIWDAKAAPGTVRISPRTDRIRKIVIGSGVGAGGDWLHFKRNVAEDFQMAFGEAPGVLVGAGFMTDADNGRGKAEACYGNLQFLDAAYQPLPGSLIF